MVFFSGKLEKQFKIASLFTLGLHLTKYTGLFDFFVKLLVDLYFDCELERIMGYF